MATLTFLRFLKLFLVSVAFVASCAATRMPEVIEVNKGTNRGSSTLGLGYASFKKEPFSYLNITCLGADLLDSEGECGLACLETPSCFSYNVAAFPDINGNLLCELLPSEMYNNSEKLIPSKGHHHFSIASQCSSWPCKNKGKCVSLYEENSYVCVCEVGFTGKNCETNVNECQSNPCLNSGTCVDKINGFNCNCPPGFDGNRCGKALYLNSSVILGNNPVYLSKLTEFLAPAVGSDSEWLLCYRASTHGWGVSEFHSRCDGLNHTITIIQVGQYIFGGYTDIPWESSGGLASTSNAFIFSLRNSKGLGPFKSMVKNPSEAIYRDSNSGPTYGSWIFDIHIADQANSNRHSLTIFGSSYYQLIGVQNQYTILAGTGNFTPDDWEVFFLA